jgi:hypothetical protein
MWIVGAGFPNNGLGLISPATSPFYEWSVVKRRDAAFTACRETRQLRGEEGAWVEIVGDFLELPLAVNIQPDGG